MIGRASLPRRVEGAFRTHQVRPPTVREAVELLYVLQEEGSEEDRALLRHILGRWLPMSVADSLMLHAPEVRELAITSLLFEGWEELEEEEGEEPPEEVGDPEETETRSWAAMISSYCATYGADPHRVYEETPFPVFLEMLGPMGKEKARQQLRAIQAASLPHMEEETRKEVMAPIQEALGEEPAEEDPLTEPMSEEERQAEMEALDEAMKATYR